VQLEALPPLISYSPLTIPLSSGDSESTAITLARRDLFDARFQLVSENVEDAPGCGVDSEHEAKERTTALEFLDAPSDLIPGVYEGGLKTWECSLDLVDYLNGIKGGDVRGKRVLEIGCGTAVPVCYLLQELFSSPSSPLPDGTDEERETQIHVQDYNASVLELVTIPNIILAWYMSPASLAYRSSLTSTSEDNEHPTSDPTVPSTLAISTHLKAAFQASLAAHNIHLRFFSGPWDAFESNLRLKPGWRYDLVLTSETIYRLDGLSDLLKLMRVACGFRDREGGLDEMIQRKLSLDTALPIEPHHTYMCLVAAKVLYFGVGGGVSEFVRAVEDGAEAQGKVKVVWEKKGGVGRRIMCVAWEQGQE